MVFCLKAATLITLARDACFAQRLLLTPSSGGYWDWWFVLMMGDNEGEMMKGRKTIWDRMKAGAVKENVADEPQITAQMKLIQPFTYQLIFNWLLFNQEFCFSEQNYVKWYGPIEWVHMAIFIYLIKLVFPAVDHQCTLVVKMPLK